jgi:hypothetical protein
VTKVGANATKGGTAGSTDPPFDEPIVAGRSMRGSHPGSHR